MVKIVTDHNSLEVRKITRFITKTKVLKTPETCGIDELKYNKKGIIKNYIIIKNIKRN